MIAVAAQVRPSLSMLCGLVMLCLISALACALVLTRSELWYLRVLSLCAWAACWRSMWCYYRTRATVVLDISGAGQLRMAQLAPGTDGKLCVPDVMPVYRLLPGSTFWSQLLVLRLESESERRTLIITPDAVDAEAYRRIAAACRWLALGSDATDRAQ